MAGLSKCSPLKRTTEVVKHREGGDPSTSRKSPGRSEFAPITLERGVTHDLAFEAWAAKVWQIGAGLGAEVSLKDFRKDVILDFYNEAGQTGDQLQDLSRMGLGVPGAAGPGRQRECRRDPAHHSRERRVGARYFSYGTHGAYVLFDARLMHEIIGRPAWRLPALLVGYEIEVMTLASSAW